jgi:Mrp family chromosome partitioning ATPase
LGQVEQESFAMVYANMNNFDDRPVHSVLVTSAGSGEGKSTVAWNLAVAGARAGANVLLIEADLRHPSIAARIGADEGAGLVEVLGGQLSLSEAVRSVSSFDRDGTQRAGQRREGELALLLAGRSGNGNGSPATPTALLASDRMGELIRTAENNYDLVVIDTPPTSVVSDAIPLVRHVSGVLVVTRMRQNTREHAQRLREQLHNLRARTLGVVVNDVDSSNDYHASVSRYLRA